MNLQERLAKAKTDRQTLVDKINEMDGQKQQLLQEVLRLDGQVRLLTELVKECASSEKS